MASCPTLVMMAAAWPPSTWPWDFILPLMIGLGCTALGRIVYLRSTKKQQGIRLGSETLPAPQDVSAIWVGEDMIPMERKRALLKALARAKRASASGSAVREIPFRITDHWGGSWNLVAHQEANGKRGFSIHRVYYSGRHAEAVAECVGLTRAP